MTAADVMVGDVIEWCGRRVTVVRIEPVPTYRRLGLYFTVRESDSTRHRLHYYADETVARAPYACVWCRDGDHEGCIEDADPYGPKCECTHAE